MQEFWVLNLNTSVPWNDSKNLEAGSLMIFKVYVHNMINREYYVYIVALLIQNR